jgi:hypothetical protein
MKCISALLAVALCVPSVALADDEKPMFKLVKGTSVTDAKKPASIVYNRDSSNAASYDLNAAIATSPHNFEIDGVEYPDLANALKLSIAMTAGIAKSTVSKSPSDIRSVGLTGGFDVAPFAKSSLTIPGSLSLDFEDNLIKLDKSILVNLEVPFVAPTPPLLFELGTIGFPAGNVQLIPIVGIYQRHITSSSAATAAPLGHVGGPHIALHAIATLGTIESKDASWYERIGLDILLRRVDDMWITTGYSKSLYSFGQATLSLKLADKPKGGWQPSIAATRTWGTDQLADMPYKNEIKIGLNLSYGI